MKTTNQTQTSSTSPRPKRRGFIHLGLLCLLSVFMVPQHGIAQQDIQFEFKKVVTPSQFNLAIESMAGGISTKFLQSKPALTPTRWVNVYATPYWISASIGGRVYLQGILQYRTKNGTYVPFPGQLVYFVDFAGRFYAKKTDNQGLVQTWINISPFNIPRDVTVPFAWGYLPSGSFAGSSKKGFFTLGR